MVDRWVPIAGAHRRPRADNPKPVGPRGTIAGFPSVVAAAAMAAHDRGAMTSASLDRLLALLLAALAATGLVSLLVGSPGSAWLFVLHDLLAGTLAAAVVVKLAGSLPRAVRGRRWLRLGVAVPMSVAVVASIVAGFVWVAGGSLVWVDLGVIRWTLLTAHVWLGLLVVPLAVAHLVRARWRLLRPGPAAPTRTVARLRSRRAVLAGGGLLAASAGLVVLAAGLDRISGGIRRFTGSRWLPEGSPAVPTTFLGEATPVVDAAAWRLVVDGAVDRPLRLDLDGLRAIHGGADLTAVLDCTAGWAIEDTWHGAPLADVLDRAGVGRAASRVTVTSVTGWSASLDLADARRCLLAWATAVGTLPAEHGAPLRLVTPDHRGLEWVKWVASVEVVE